MRLSPMDIRQQQFTVRFRGFDRQEVEAFLEDVAEDFEGLLRENTHLREQLALHEERARGLGETERTLKETLITAHRLAEELKAQARREAELLLQDARLQSEKLLEEARAEEARMRHEIGELRRARRQLLEDVRGTLERYVRLVSEDLKGDGEGGRPA